MFYQPNIINNSLILIASILLTNYFFGWYVPSMDEHVQIQTAQQLITGNGLTRFPPWNFLETHPHLVCVGECNISSLVHTTSWPAGMSLISAIPVMLLGPTHAALFIKLVFIMLATISWTACFKTLLQPNSTATIPFILAILGIVTTQSVSSTSEILVSAYTGYSTFIVCRYLISSQIDAKDLILLNIFSSIILITKYSSVMVFLCITIVSLIITYQKQPLLFIKFIKGTILSLVPSIIDVARVKYLSGQVSTQVLATDVAQTIEPELRWLWEVTIAVFYESFRIPELLAKYLNLDEFTQIFLGIIFFLAVILTAANGTKKIKLIFLWFLFIGFAQVVFLGSITILFIDEKSTWIPISYSRYYYHLAPIILLIITACLNHNLIFLKLFNAMSPLFTVTAILYYCYTYNSTRPIRLEFETIYTETEYLKDTYRKDRILFYVPHQIFVQNFSTSNRRFFLGLPIKGRDSDYFLNSLVVIIPTDPLAGKIFTTDQEKIYLKHLFEKSHSKILPGYYVMIRENDGSVIEDDKILKDLGFHEFN